MAERPTGWGGAPVQAPTISAMHEAAKQLEGKVVKTPLVPFTGDGDLSSIFLKPEILQPIGSFKLRGALNWALNLSASETAKGFCTHSAGNTAQALGQAAQICGTTARSLLPDRTPENKISAIRGYGVDPLVMPMDDLLAFIFRAGWKDEPYSYLNPWADPHMVAGNATIGLEIVDELPDIDTVFVPVGGGGLIAGVGSAMRALRPDVRVIGVQPQACPALHTCLAVGHPTWVESQPTVCDTALPLVVDELFPLLQEVVDEVCLIDDDTVKRVVGLLALKGKLVVEAAGALAVAAAMTTPVEQRGKSVCILSGGSIGADKLKSYISEYQEYENANH